MPIEIKIKDRIAKVEVLEKEGSKYKVRVDNKVFDIDAELVQKDVYSILYNGQSINMSMIEGETANQYIVSTRYNDFEVEVIDARARYMKASASEFGDSENTIASPMPGKIVKLMFSENDTVTKGDTVIIVSAMKMESEYKSPCNGIIKRIHVKAGDTIEGNEPLVEIEPEKE